ncbi:gliding motility protein GldN [Cytophagales bacterium RKSG123]|nr:gliding motility protein GldN [Xanthovirga aplysinae]
MALCLLSSLFGLDQAKAQEIDTGYNPNSLRPVHESDIMYKKRLWRRMDLREKQNRPFFAMNHEISRIIIDAVEMGLIYPYTNDSLNVRMSKEEFFTRLSLPDEEAFEDESDFQPSGWDEPENDQPVEQKSLYFLPRQVSVIEITEDMIFDKARSRMYFDIQAITLVIPGKEFETGLQKELGTFKFKDLVALFKSQPKDAIWYNPYNTAKHLNLSDAFELRLFAARLIKVENPNDAFIADQYPESQRAGIIASQRIEYELLEQESELWEY